MADTHGMSRAEPGARPPRTQGHVSVNCPCSLKLFGIRNARTPQPRQATNDEMTDQCCPASVELLKCAYVNTAVSPKALCARSRASRV